MTSPVSRRDLLLAGGTIVAASAVGAGTTAAATPDLRTRPGGHSGGGLVVAWNQTLLRIVRTPGAQPATVHPTRSFAILHAAIHDAVTSSGRSHLHVGAPTAAAAQAAHDVLVALYPAQVASLDWQLRTDLATVEQRHAREIGIEAGRLVARRLLDLRRNDGSSATPSPLPPGTEPGQYRPTPPGFLPAAFTHWSHVTPFVVDRVDRFRPEAYPTLSGRRYAAAINEVKRLGQDTSTSRTSDQTEQAHFWAAPIWNYWNEITQTAVLAQGKDLVHAARIFAHLNLALADAVIAFYDAKYHYRIWRPITAIRLADSDTNPATVADPAWNSLATTPPDPAYPGAHSVISQTSATLLTAEFGRGHRLAVTSEALPGVTRHFTTFQSIADEAGLSRIYAGVHTRLDHYAGRTLGHHLARATLTRTPTG
ncbi:vanadium-dependent haloperoxidase [Kribbella monticola]|uniref:vanadium-dependent haloperoxidase n=1 Tax=Kribbella monticola TaxID=2185285 RepID=UPI000DD42BE4|nr:vanadium-dependent haloperoxidase [Kribbella monticola]